MSLEEYEILGIVGDLTSSTYKVQNKITKAVFMWHAVDYSLMNDAEKQNLLKNLNERKSHTHPHFLKFYNYVEHEESKILYISTEFCKIGNFRKLIGECVKNNQGLREELIIRIMYQICFTLKTSRNTIFLPKAEEIFLDDDYNIKLFNFSCKNEKLESTKMLELGSLISQMCTLKYDNTWTQDISANLINYSKEFCVLLKNLSNIISSPDSECVDKILCHPTVLLMSSRWTQDTCFFKKEECKISIPLEENSEVISREETQEIAQRLRKLETSLKMKESKLKERELSLQNREKKVTLLERTVREKLTQAELYLKRCRDSRSSSSGSSKGSVKTTKLSYEHLDTSFSADCGDSVIIPTSRKLNVSKIVKPAPFTRTLSERKVRFKGHSPLKDIDYNRRRPKSILKEFSMFGNLPKSNQTLDKISEQCSDKLNSSENVNKENVRKSRKLFPSSGNGNKKYSQTDVEAGCRPISWTEESKKQAFELLRVMNSANTDKDYFDGEMKHTYL